MHVFISLFYLDRGNRIFPHPYRVATCGSDIVQRNVGGNLRIGLVDLAHSYSLRLTLVILCASVDHRLEAIQSLRSLILLSNCQPMSCISRCKLPPETPLHQKNTRHTALAAICLGW
jgi:hypothetical protein